MTDFFFRFKSMELLQFATLADQYEPDRTNGHTEVGFWYEALSRTLNVQLSFVLTHSEDHTPLMKAELKSEFEIKEESLEQITKNDELVFPSSLLAHLAALTYSSLRGVIYAKTENTAFRSFILPVEDIQTRIRVPYVYKKAGE